MQTIETALVSSIKNATKEDKFFALKLSNLLTKHINSNNQLEITKHLEKLAYEFEELSNFDISREYFSAASDFYKKLKINEKSIEMKIQAAESWVKEAIAHQTDSPLLSNIFAANFYEKAIHTYRKIPNKNRAVYNIDNRIAELRTKLNLVNKKALEEMPLISTGKTDISDLVEMAKNSVTGKKPLDALLTLATIYQGAKVNKIRESSERSIRKYPLSKLFSGIYKSKDGRVIAKYPSTGFDSELDKTTVWAKMVDEYSREISLVVQSLILSALEIIHLEHRIKEADFYSIVRNSSNVPEGREDLIAKALFAGYDNDFITALHILIPQIEHLVRFHLKHAGVKTSNLDNDGIETENGLSTLMDNPEVNTVFGEDLAFEFKALLCSPFGANLRNELAHGLLGYEECQSIYSIYAWWLVLKLVFNTSTSPN